MDILSPIVAGLSYAVLHPLMQSTLLYSLLILLFLVIYCKVTIGKCKSDQDMTGKTVLITGATSGIGKVTALELARRNARIILACRNLEMAKKVAREITSATGNANIEIKKLDLMSFESVRKCAKDVLRTEEKLHVLINNAGTLESSVKLTEDGWETSIQVNHLSHFLLTLLLLDLLKRSSPSRIINVSSLVYFLTTLDISDINAIRHSRLSLFLADLYTRSKLANILFTRELATRLSGTGVTVNALHPGIVQTALIRKNTSTVSHVVGKLVIWLFGKTPEDGAQTSLYLAVHPEVEKVTGKFFYDCKERYLLGQANNRQLAKDLFELSEKIVGITYQSTESDGSLRS